MRRPGTRFIALLVLMAACGWGAAASVTPIPAQPLASTPTPLPLFALPPASAYRAFASSSIAARP
ncbi:MAG: hypothetical protein NZM00_13705, partial [Anaerolinea sp.]|nr:hypothetical protein [Anaerolinea sp.]